MLEGQLSAFWGVIGSEQARRVLDDGVAEKAYGRVGHHSVYNFPSRVASHSARPITARGFHWASTTAKRP